MVNVLLKYMIIFWPNDPYYAGIMLDAFSYLLCSKLCWHNRLVPTFEHAVLQNQAFYVQNYAQQIKLC